MVGSRHDLLLRDFGVIPYEKTLEAMRVFTDSRDESTPDEFWLLQHEPVFTLGQAGRMIHVLNPGDIPVVRSDRGGQVTYHGPGQIVCYLMVDLRRLHLGVRGLVEAIENAIIATLGIDGIEAKARRDAPGVYVNGSKIASLGLRIRRGRSYHGLSLNVAMDLEPFSRINPCGMAGLAVTDLRTLGVDRDLADISADLVRQLKRSFGYDAGCQEM